MSTTNSDDTSPPTSSQRPASLAEAIGLLSTYPAYASIESPLLLQFVGDLIGEYPNLVMEKVIVMRSGSIAEALREYRGEV